MGAAAEELQHPVGVVGAGGLAEDMAVADDAGVGAEDDERVFGRVERAAEIPDGLSLLFGEALDVGGGDLVRESIFVDVGGVDSENETRLGEEFAAARRG